MNFLISSIVKFYMENRESGIFLLIFNAICCEPKSVFYLRIVHLVDLLYYKQMYFSMHFKVCVVVSL